MILNKKNKIKIVDKLNKLIDDIVSGKTRYELHFANGVTTANYRDIKYMADKKRVLMTCMFDINKKPIKIEKSDIDVVIDKYNSITSKLKKYKWLLKDLCENKNKKENKKHYKEILDMELYKEILDKEL